MMILQPTLILILALLPVPPSWPPRGFREARWISAR